MKKRENSFSKAKKMILDAKKNECSTLSLMGIGLEQVPTEIGGLSKLRRLNLENNSLMEIPREIGGLKSLENLYLNKNSIEELPSEIGKLDKLEKLNLEHNNIKTIPKEIGSLFNLKKLYLYSNKISSLPKEIQRLKSLEKLYLYDNELEYFPVNLSYLTSLKVLNLDKNHIQRLPPDIVRLVNLETLILSRNKLELLPCEIGGLKSLSTLHLNFNSLVEIPVEISSLKNLRVLKLSGNELSDNVLADFLNRKSIEWLFQKLCTPPAAIFKVPKEFRTAFKQYLVFFDDYLEATLGFRAGLEVKTDQDGLRLEISETSILPRDLDEYINDYLGFIRTNLDQLKDKIPFNNEATDVEKELLIARLESQVSHLRIQLKLEKVAKMKLEDFLTEALKRPVVVHNTAISSSSSKAFANIGSDFNLANVLPELQDLLTKIPELKMAAEKVDCIPISSSPEDVQRSGVLPKIRQYIKNSKDTNDAISTIRQLGKHYNEIAQWCGLPTIPAPLLGSIKK